MLFLFSSIFIKYHYKITQNIIKQFDSFNFDTHGEFIFNIQSNESQEISVAMFPESQIDTLEKFQKEKVTFCNESLNDSIVHFTIPILNGTGFYQGSFNESCVIIPSVSKCINSTQPIIVEVTFHNSHSYLSTDVYPLIFSKGFYSISYFILFILWIVFFFMRKKNVSFIFVIMTITLILFLIDNVFTFIVLYHFSRSDESFGLTNICYFTRSISLIFFYATLALSAFNISLNGQKFPNEYLVSSFATGIFLGVPITCTEYIRKTNSQIYVNCFASVYAFLAWTFSFSILYHKGWDPIFFVHERLKKEGKDLKDTALHKQYYTLNRHIILYAVVCLTTLFYILIPYPMKCAIVASQTILDVSLLAELLTSVILYWKLPTTFGYVNLDIPDSHKKLTEHLLSDSNRYHENELQSISQNSPFTRRTTHM